MTSSLLMWALFAAYVVIAAVAACEKNWPRMFYFVGAGIIIAATVKMRQS